MLVELMDRVALLDWGLRRFGGEIVRVERTLLQTHCRLAPGQTRTVWIDVLCPDGDGGRS